MWANLRENQTSWPASSVVVGRGLPEQASRQAGGAWRLTLATMCAATAGPAQRAAKTASR